MPRLKAKAISLAEVMRMSISHYAKEDSKSRRAKLDIINARLTVRKNYSYDRSNKIWVQEPRKEVKIILQVRSRPVSYKVPAWQPAKRIYPVTFIIRDIHRGMNSPFKWRTGSLNKPVIPQKGAPKLLRERIMNSNIKRGIQMQFFFELSHVIKKFGLLFGPDWTNGPPKVTNPALTPFFDKHSFFAVQKILVPLFSSSRKELLIGKIFK